MHTPGNLYADLAGYYDQFCNEVDYTEQCEFAVRAFECFAHVDGREYLDLACGTGKHLALMQEQGFAASGLDNSAAMLEQAAVRCPDARLLLCDLAGFDQQEEFSLITCFLYSLHYSHPTSALEETLKRAWNALKPGGVFIFNTVDARGISERTIKTQLSEGDTHLSFQSGWQYSGEGEVMNLVLSITRESTEGRQTWHDQHRMTALTLPQLSSMLESVGFEVTLLEHDYRVMVPWNGESFNAIVVAVKPS
ncbi:class I SAM-dependent methyltransferase [Proteobacteria bacterium 005FR1]|nr:class I SAM-dependent methyltransferase [Proteobacteria bacterium 005FR1]